MKKNLFISIVAILIGGFFVSSVVADDNTIRYLGKIQRRNRSHPVSNVTAVVGPLLWSLCQPEHCPWC